MRAATTRRPTARRLPFAAIALAAAAALALLAGCASSDGPDGTKAAPAQIEDTAAAGGSQGSAAGSLPAVKNATNLSVKPVPSAGQGTPPTTLQSKDLVVGEGTTAAPTSTVTVHYVGVLWTDGKQFDASWDRGQPAEFALDQVIPGFKDGIAGMKVGGRREIVIPPALGYGSQATGPIPANSTLTFVVDLKAVK